MSLDILTLEIMWVCLSLSVLFSMVYSGVISLLNMHDMSGHDMPVVTTKSLVTYQDIMYNLRGL